MKIPKKIKIGGIDYRVKLIKMGEAPPLTKNHADGETHYDTCMIYLDTSLDKQRMFQVFLHEIIHALEWGNNFSTSEDYIQAMSSGLYQVLKDNRLLRNS